MKELNLNKFELVLLPGKSPPPPYLEYYTKAYDCWREVWKECLIQETTKKSFYSDDFTRQDEIMSLFYDGQCTGLVFLRWVHMNETPLREDSFFKLWPEEAIAKLCVRGPHVVVNSNFSVHQNFRRNAMGISWKNLIACLSHKRFLHSGQDAMAGQLRVSKGMPKAGAATGVTLLMPGQPTVFVGDSVDLIAIYQGSPINKMPILWDIVEETWDRVVPLAKPIYPENKTEEESQGITKTQLEALIRTVASQVQYSVPRVRI